MWMPSPPLYTIIANQPHKCWPIDPIFDKQVGIGYFLPNMQGSQTVNTCCYWWTKWTNPTRFGIPCELITTSNVLWSRGFPIHNANSSNILSLHFWIKWNLLIRVGLTSFFQTWIFALIKWVDVELDYEFCPQSVEMWHHLLISPTDELYNEITKIGINIWNVTNLEKHNTYVRFMSIRNL